MVRLQQVSDCHPTFPSDLPWTSRCGTALYSNFPDLTMLRVIVETIFEAEGAGREMGRQYQTEF